MKRILSTLLILTFGLGPLAEALPAGAEPSLPACCRRHGAHHCAISTEKAAKTAQASPSSTPILTAPSRCPYFPSYTGASTTPVHAMVAAAVGLPVLLAHAHSPAASRAAALLSQIRTRAGRAPPSSLIG
jgi:hypothetical protein